MRKIIPLLILVVAVAALSGCSASTLPGVTVPGASNPPAAASSSAVSSGSGSKSGGSGATTAAECAVAHTALAKVVTATLSSGYQKDDVCYFGVGPNGNVSGSALAALYGDSVFVGYTTADVDSQYQAAADAYSGSKKLAGVGSQAQYYDGGNGNPQIVARSSGALCTVQTNFNNATEVGLSKPSDSRTISAADVPKLASELGGVCSALFGG